MNQNFVKFRLEPIIFIVWTRFLKIWKNIAQLEFFPFSVEISRISWHLLISQTCTIHGHSQFLESDLVHNRVLILVFSDRLQVLSLFFFDCSENLYAFSWHWHVFVFLEFVILDCSPWRSKLCLNGEYHVECDVKFVFFQKRGWSWTESRGRVGNIWNSCLTDESKLCQVSSWSDHF